MAEERKQGTNPQQKDKTDRPQPATDAAEGDLETIEEDLRNQEKKQRSGGGSA